MLMKLMPGLKFHLYFMSSFCADILWPKKLQSQTVIREAHLYVKGTRKMLIILTPRVNFTNIL
jgi:hypothetical protein